MIQIILNYEKEMRLFLTRMIKYNEEYWVRDDIDDDDEHLKDDR
jgi:hypothetical protein